MTIYHQDARQIDALGFDRIHDHFGISRQSFNYWRRKGIPARHLKTIAMLVEISDKKKVGKNGK